MPLSCLEKESQYVQKDFFLFSCVWSVVIVNLIFLQGEPSSPNTQTSKITSNDKMFELATLLRHNKLTLCNKTMTTDKISLQTSCHYQIVIKNIEHVGQSNWLILCRFYCITEGNRIANQPSVFVISRQARQRGGKVERRTKQRATWTVRWRVY